MYCLHVPNELSINIEGKDIITMTQTVLWYGTAALGRYELQIHQNKVVVSFNYLYPVNSKPIRISIERLLTLKNPQFFHGMDNQTRQHIINKIKEAVRLLDKKLKRYFENERLLKSIKQLEDN